MIDVCVICARHGSKEIKNKNIKKIFGKELIIWSIEQALNSRLFYKVYVSTDSKKIANISKKHGAEIPFLRPAALSNDKSSKFLVWKHAAKAIEKNTKKKIRYFIDLDCTNPIRTKKDIIGVINLLKRNRKADGALTICKARKNPYFNMVEKSKNNMLKISKSLKNKVFSRHQAPKVFEIIANIYCLRGEYLKKAKHLFSGNIIGHEIEQNKAFDVDSKYDFEIMKMFLKKLKKND